MHSTAGIPEKKAILSLGRGGVLSPFARDGLDVALAYVFSSAKQGVCMGVSVTVSQQWNCVQARHSLIPRPLQHLQFEAPHTCP